MDQLKNTYRTCAKWFVCAGFASFFFMRVVVRVLFGPKNEALIYNRQCARHLEAHEMAAASSHDSRAKSSELTRCSWGRVSDMLFFVVVLLQKGKDGGLGCGSTGTAVTRVYRAGFLLHRSSRCRAIYRVRFFEGLGSPR